MKAMRCSRPGRYPTEVACSHTVWSPSTPVNRPSASRDQPVIIGWDAIRKSEEREPVSTGCDATSTSPGLECNATVLLPPSSSKQTRSHIPRFVFLRCPLDFRHLICYINLPLKTPKTHKPYLPVRHACSLGCCFRMIRSDGILSFRAPLSGTHMKVKSRRTLRPSRALRHHIQHDAALVC